MTIAEAKKDIIETIIEAGDIETEVTENSELIGDLGLSSMLLMVILGELEDTYDVELDIRKMKGIHTVGELCDYVIEQL